MEPSTDPRTSAERIHVRDIPLYVGRARRECGEVASLCEAIAKDCSSREVRTSAHRLWQQAIRLGQAANALSAVPIGDALIWLPTRMPFWTKLKIFLNLGFQIMKA